MSCGDKIKDKSSFGEANSSKNRAEMEGCVAKCADEMMKVWPTYTKKMKEYFNKGLYLQ